MPFFFTRTAFFTLCIVLFSVAGYSQAPAIQWQKSYGGTNSDLINAMVQVSGGYAMIGGTYSSDGDVTYNHGQSDFWLIVTDTGGTIKWQKCYGGAGYDAGFSLANVNGGGFVMAGETLSTNDDVTGEHTDSMGATIDMWVVRINDTGKIMWEKALGGSGNDNIEFDGIEQTKDGGYIVAGGTDSRDGDVTGLHLDSLGRPTQDAWVVKLDNTGAIVWEKTYGGSGDDDAFSIHQTTDGGYIMAGITDSKDGDVTGLHGSNNDVWVVKLTATGVISWAKTYGGTSSDGVFRIRQIADGGYIVVANTGSDDGDVSGNHGSGDIWAVKLDDTGRIVWQKCLGGSAEDFGCDIRQLLDGSFIVAGNTSSIDGDVTGLHLPAKGYTYPDDWVVRLDKNGTLLWQKCLGGTNAEAANSVIQTSDSGYLVGGQTYSDDGDVTYNHGSLDGWVVKLARDTTIKDTATVVSVSLRQPDIQVYPTINDGTVQVDLPQQYRHTAIVVYDMLGRQQRLTTEPTTAGWTVHINGAPNGMYLLQVMAGGYNNDYRIVVRR